MFLWIGRLTHVTSEQKGRHMRPLNRKTDTCGHWTGRLTRVASEQEGWHMYLWTGRLTHVPLNRKADTCGLWTGRLTHVAPEQKGWHMLPLDVLADNVASEQEDWYMWLLNKKADTCGLWTVRVAHVVSEQEGICGMITLQAEVSANSLPVLMHWRYCSLALSHRSVDIRCHQFDFYKCMPVFDQIIRSWASSPVCLCCVLHTDFESIYGSFYIVLLFSTCPSSVSYHL